MGEPYLCEWHIPIDFCKAVVEDTDQQDCWPLTRRASFVPARKEESILHINKGIDHDHLHEVLKMMCAGGPQVSIDSFQNQILFHSS